jgi:predicted Ser/Thr protein kinase
MSNFTDHENRNWKFQFSLPAIRKITEKTGASLSVVYDTDFVRKIHQDVLFMLDVAVILLERQLRSNEVSQEDFETAIHGDNVEKLANAVIVAYMEFQSEDLRTPLLKGMQEFDKKRASKLASMDDNFIQQAIEEGAK